jgi:hypothetical protein
LNQSHCFKQFIQSPKSTRHHHKSLRIFHEHYFNKEVIKIQVLSPSMYGLKCCSNGNTIFNPTEVPPPRCALCYRLP